MTSDNSEEWVKGCECKGTSSTCQVRSKETGRGKDYINLAVYYYPEPSCDLCGKPWVKREAKEVSHDQR